MVIPDIERRKGPDLLVRSLTWANVIAAVALMAAFFLTAKAKPQVESFFIRFFHDNLYRRPGWDMHLIKYIAWLFLLSGLTGVAGLIVNSRRRRRKDDYIRVTLVLCLLVSLLGLGLSLRQLVIYG